MQQDSNFITKFPTKLSLKKIGADNETGNIGSISTLIYQIYSVLASVSNVRTAGNKEPPMNKKVERIMSVLLGGVASAGHVSPKVNSKPTKEKSLTKAQKLRKKKRKTQKISRRRNRK